MENGDGLHLLTEVLSVIPDEAKNVVIIVGAHKIACSSDILSEKSAFFRSRLSTFADTKEFVDDSYVITLPVEEVTLEALAVCIKFMQSGEPYLREENAFDVLRASAFLQIDSLAEHCCSLIRKRLNKCNLVTAWDFSNAFVIPELKAFIDRDIQNFHAKRQRKYGPFDLKVNIKGFSIPCHKNIVLERSARLKSLCKSPPLVFETVDISSIFNGELMHYNNQAVFNVIEWMYSAPTPFLLLTSESCLEHLRVVRALHCDSMLDLLCDQFQPSLPEDWKEFYIASTEMGNSSMRTVALLHMARSFEQLRSAAVVLSFEDMKLLLKCNLLNASESEVLATLLCWHDHAPEARATHFEELLSHVRMQQVPREEIARLTEGPLATAVRAVISAFESKIEWTLCKRAWPQQLIMVELPHKALALTEAQRKKLGVHRFDFASAKWATEALPGLSGDYTAAVAQDGMLYLAEQRPEGDWEGHSIVLHSLDLKTGSFKHNVAANTMPTHPRNVCSFVASENSLMFASSKISADVDVYIERYFISEQRWVSSEVKVNKRGRKKPDKESLGFENACLVSGRTASYLVNAGLREEAGADVTVAEVASATSTSLLSYPEAPKSEPKTISCRDSSLSFGSSFAMFSETLVRVGGFDSKATTLSRADIIDVTSAQLRHREALPNMQSPRYLCGVVQKGDRLLVAGGYERPRYEFTPRPVKTMEEYNPSSRRWVKFKEPMPDLESGYVKLFVVGVPVKILRDQITAGVDIFDTTYGLQSSV